MKKIISLLLIAVMCMLVFVGCGDTAKVIVAEKGSAGEAVAMTLEDYDYWMRMNSLFKIIHK